MRPRVRPICRALEWVNPDAQRAGVRDRRRRFDGFNNFVKGGNRRRGSVPVQLADGACTRRAGCRVWPRCPFRRVTGSRGSLLLAAPTNYNSHRQRCRLHPQHALKGQLLSSGSGEGRGHADQCAGHVLSPLVVAACPRPTTPRASSTRRRCQAPGFGQPRFVSPRRRDSGRGPQREPRPLRSRRAACVLRGWSRVKKPHMGHRLYSSGRGALRPAPDERPAAPRSFNMRRPTLRRACARRWTMPSTTNGPTTGLCARGRLVNSDIGHGPPAELALLKPPRPATSWSSGSHLRRSRSSGLPARSWTVAPVPAASTPAGVGAQVSTEHILTPYVKTCGNHFRRIRRIDSPLNFDVHVTVGAARGHQRLTSTIRHRRT